MNSGHKLYNFSFAWQAFEIDCNNDEAYSLAEFLFQDFPKTTETLSTHKYSIITSSLESEFSLFEGDIQLYSGDSRYQLAYTLINEIIFHCINKNDSHHALHAGAIYHGKRCILLPGKSGTGKSTLTSWMIMNGFQYLSDELVFIDADGKVLPLTRPISLKVGPSHQSWLLSDENDAIITDASGSMIPHRLLNPDFEPKQPIITDIIFPEFNSDIKPGLQEISPAKSSLYLLRSHVNARNLPEHGVSQLATIVRRCRSFILRYGCFDDLEYIFNKNCELLL